MYFLVLQLLLYWEDISLFIQVFQVTKMSLLKTITKKRSFATEISALEEQMGRFKTVLANKAEIESEIIEQRVSTQDIVDKIDTLWATLKIKKISILQSINMPFSQIIKILLKESKPV